MQTITFINKTLILKTMPKEKLVCSSCKKNVANSSGTAGFKCPSCGKTEIVRCIHCREIAAKYICHNCNFEGPN
tara:strand:- start:466 stop:687 length:222 start_codon:yes stop_codon:yes gene_type:complete